MARYARGVYGSALYGRDLWSEYSVQPMYATLTVDETIGNGSSIFTDAFGNAVYNRIQVSWLEPSTVSEFRLLRSNSGFSTSPNDPFATVLVSDPSTLPEIHLDSDPDNRVRRAYIDTSVDQGREYFYTVWVLIPGVGGEWFLAGQAVATTSVDHNTLETIKSALPAYMWNRYSGPGDGVDTQYDDDDENFLGRWLQASAWVLDQSLTKIDGLRNVWDPSRTPSVLLDEALNMWGLPVEPVLGARAERVLLNNAAAITGGRGTEESVQLLVESLTGFNCTTSNGKNIIGSTDESSFEGLTVYPGSDDVFGGTGRWAFFNAIDASTRLQRVVGDNPNVNVHIARDPNADDDWGPSTRFGVRMNAITVGTPLQMNLGEYVRVEKYVAGSKYADITSVWPHGLEPGDPVTLTLDGTTYTTAKVASTRSLFIFQIDATDAGSPLNTTVTPGYGYISGKNIPVYQGVPVSPNTIYSLVGKFKSSGRTDITLTIKFWDRFGNFLTSQVADAAALGVTVNNDVWYTLYVTATAPALASTATLAIQQTAGPYLSVDSLMVAPGGTPYETSGTYDSATAYQGTTDYTFEDANLLTVTVDTTKSPAGVTLPDTVATDLKQIFRERLVDILSKNLPVGTAFLLDVL